MSTQPLSSHRHPILLALPQEARETLERSADERHFRRRQFIFTTGAKNEHLYLLVSGRVKLYCGAPSGREVTLDIVNANEFFGESQLFETNALYGCTAEVMEDAVVLVFRRSDFASAIGASPEALRELAKLQCAHRNSAENRLAEYIFYDVPARLAHLLAQMAGTNGRKTKEGMLIRIKLTHQELANLVGSTRETTTLILNEFRRRGLLEFTGRKIVVSDPEALLQLGGTTQAGRRARSANGSHP
jgi:CRP-like cAMP-binding protein